MSVASPAIHLVLASLLTTAFAMPAAAEKIPLNRDWLFAPRDVDGGERESLDDRAWQKVIVPHDFSIEDRPDTGTPGDPQTPTGSASGYMRGGVGWYRRHVALDTAQTKKVVLLRFEAVYMDADIWVNGIHLAHHDYGYTAFDVDLGDRLHVGDNVIAVRVQHDDPSSRWYAGSGILRPVSLEILEPLHIDPQGPAIRTPAASLQQATVDVSTGLRNAGKAPASIELTSRIRDQDGNIVATDRLVVEVAAGGSGDGRQTLGVARPAFWSLEQPNLYVLEQELASEGRVIDRRTTRFGIRIVTIDAKRGLLLNGRRVLLRGGNIHHDNYMLGGAGLPRADERKVELMKAAGYNAVRSAHNPASQATLDAADRLGLLVIDEAFDAWTIPKTTRDYARFFNGNWQDDLTSLVVSGRNHPSVLMWSIGNEIPEQSDPAGAARAKMLADFVRRLDPSRPITAAVNSSGPRVASFFATLDVAGYNYQPRLYAEDHERYPNRVIFGSESYSAQAFDYWRPTDSMPWVIGDFVWTAIDYLGEAGIGWTGYSGDWDKLAPYPWQLAYCGEIDATGRRRPAAYYREILWGTASQRVAAFVRWPDATGSLRDRDIFGKDAHREWALPDLHPSWTWPGHEGQPLEVVVYSALPEVELFLNGHSLGHHTVGVDTRYETSFTVPYAAGTLRAVGSAPDDGKSEWILETAGPPASIRLSVDRATIAAGGQDVAYVTATLVDAKGRETYRPADDRTLVFAVNGAGRLAGVGNGNPVAVESFISGQRTSFNGRAVAVIRGGETAGPISVTASSPGLPPSTLQIAVGGE